MESIKLERDGVDCERFEQSIAKTKFAYLIPDFQNPSTTTYSSKKRECVAKILEKHGALLIEDAPYNELYFYEKLPPISQNLPNQSYHLGSFSKSLAPSLRLGWIRASKEKIDALLPYKESVDLHSSTVAQYLVYEYLHNQEGGYDEHLKLVRERYKAKANLFCELIDNHLPMLEYQRPQGGMFVYGRLKCVDTKELVQKTLEQNVVFVPGVEFGGQSDSLRLNFTRSDLEQSIKGLQIINQIYQRLKD